MGGRGEEGSESAGEKKPVGGGAEVASGRERGGEWGWCGEPRVASQSRGRVMPTSLRGRGVWECDEDFENMPPGNPVASSRHISTILLSVHC